MEMHELGKQLYEERVRQGLTLEHIQDEIKVSLNFLKALENGDMDQLPHPVYARGFMQNYAKFLGLDWQKMGEEFARIYSVEDDSGQLDELPTVLKDQKQARLFSYAVKASVLTLTLVIILGAGWLFYTSYWDDAREYDPDEDTEIAMDLPEAEQFNQDFFNDYPLHTYELEPVEPEEPVSDVEEDPVPEELVEPLPQEEEQEEEQAEALEHESLIDEPVAVEEEEEEEEELPRMFQMVIEAHEECWLMYETEDATRDFFLRPGDSIEVEYKDRLRLRLGNAGGVSITINGEPYLLDAESGEVRTVEFDGSS
ncbi:helix-turn-helix domain-containing protein [Desulfonatronospira sp.]|uniref:helix-turn-helix domain-containing protein n=1 Tax=Desulfonatronospira sp. TaxID=1962951 RepID=UPI0025C42A9F|nr:helix-turn-helix domain-containing protein [Desulfonatronospira sp.]